MRRRVTVTAALAALAAAGVLAWLSLRNLPAGVTTARLPTAVATVTLGTVANRQTQEGTLTYAGQITAANNQAPGLYTRLPGTGDILRPGDAAYEVDGTPVTVMAGARPMWRSCTAGMTAGADVRQLEQNLVAAGDDPDHQITVDDDFTWATTAAIERWQAARGLAVTGTIPLGEILFLPGPVRVVTVAVTLGSSAQPGATVLTGTTLTPAVTVNLDPQSQLPVRDGQPVLITLPDGATTGGHIEQIQPATSSSSSSSSPGSSSDASGSGTTQAVIPVVIRLDHPGQAGPADDAPVQVQFTTAERRAVLTVPTTALLAEPGGGYAVQVITDRGSHLVPVISGLFDATSGRAEVASPRLRAGLRVEIPA